MSGTMASSAPDELDEAASLLRDLDASSDPAHRLAVLESGIDLLDEHAAADPDAKRRIEALRRDYLRGVLDLLSAPGARRTGILDQAKVLLFKLEPGRRAALEASRRNLLLSPRPADGATVGVSPPGLTWLPMPGACGYRVEIFS